MDDIIKAILAIDAPRVIVAIAGGPASGKSTLAEKLVGELNAREAGLANLMPMDGFHLDDRILSARGHLSRKGAPHTFDADGFGHMLSRIRAGSHDVIVPTFDRSLEISRAGSLVIEASVKYVIIEGNYLLLDANPWRDFIVQYDLSVMVDVSMDVIETRLYERWSGLDIQIARTKVEANDLPNARLISGSSMPADMVFRF